MQDMNALLPGGRRALALLALVAASHPGTALTTRADGPRPVISLASVVNEPLPRADGQPARYDLHFRKLLEAELRRRFACQILIRHSGYDLNPDSRDRTKPSFAELHQPPEKLPICDFTVWAFLSTGRTPRRFSGQVVCVDVRTGRRATVETRDLDVTNETEAVEAPDPAL